MDLSLTIKVLMPVLFLVGLVLFLFRKPAAPTETPITPTTPARDSHDPLVALRSMTAPAPGIAPAPAEAMPPALAEWLQRSATELVPAQMAAMVRRIGVIPRPPQSLHQLVSPEFLAEASAAKLGTLVMAEPQIAAKVLAGANSPFYALPKPLSSISQAITYLGINTVRSICLRYLLDQSFKEASPQHKHYFDQLSNASAFASELCFKLAQWLQMPDSGALVTQVVLSFLGQQAAASLLPPARVRDFASQGFLERAKIERAELGLCAADMGDLLMRAWALPPNVSDEVRDIDRVLTTPAQAFKAQRGARLALCYLSARLGERLASGELRDFAAFDLAAEQSPEFFFMRQHLADPELARLPEFLGAPELLAAARRMTDSVPYRNQ